MNLIEKVRGGNHEHHLELPIKYLMSTLTTSIESEGAFSAAAYIGNKLRSRLREFMTIEKN